MLPVKDTFMSEYPPLDIDPEDDEFDPSHDTSGLRVAGQGRAQASGATESATDENFSGTPDDDVTSADDLPDLVEEQTGNRGRLHRLRTMARGAGRVALHTPLLGGQIRKAQEMAFTQRPDAEEGAREQARVESGAKKDSAKDTQKQREAEDRTFTTLGEEYRSRKAKGKTVTQEEQRRFLNLALQVIKPGHHNRNRANAMQMLREAGVSEGDLERAIYGVSYSEPSQGEILAGQRQALYLEQRAQKDEARATRDARDEQRKEEAHADRLETQRAQRETFTSHAAAAQQTAEYAKEQAAHARRAADAQEALLNELRAARARTEQQPASGAGEERGTSNATGPQVTIREDLPSSHADRDSQATADATVETVDGDFVDEDHEQAPPLQLNR